MDEYIWANAREHEGTERDTPSPRFVICHFIDWLSNGRKYVFRDVRIRANLDLMWLVRK